MSADGKVISELYVHKRDVVKISKIPRHLRNALLSMEDRQFYTLLLCFFQVRQFVYFEYCFYIDC